MKEGDERRKIFRWMLFRRPREPARLVPENFPSEAVGRNSPPREVAVALAVAVALRRESRAGGRSAGG